MRRKIIYIINPVSGTRTKKSLQKVIEEKTREQKIPYFIFPSVADGNYDFLETIIKEEKITDVVIAGGDGTVSQVVGNLMQNDLAFGVIPCGSGNGLALTAGISKRPEKALQIIFNGKSSLIDGFYVNRQFACMLCGLGFDAKVAHDFAREPTRGLGTYIKQVLQNLFTASIYSFDLQLKNIRFETQAYFISIANSNQFGNNFTIAPKASITDGLLDVVIVTNQNKLNFVLQTLKQVAGWNRLQSELFVERRQGVIYFQTDQLSITNNNEAPMHIDGDPVESSVQLKIRMKKKCFRLIQPS
jgi:YegS/Rv2252/BmrU family lipid kinase